jgi:hypothetical protein
MLGTKICEDQLTPIYRGVHPSQERSENTVLVVSVAMKSPLLENSNCEGILKALVGSKVGTDKKVKILIADDIARFTFEAFDNFKPQKAVIAASKLGDRFYTSFQTSITKLNMNNTVSISRWNDLYAIHTPELIKYISEESLLQPRMEAIVDSIVAFRHSKGCRNRSVEKVKQLSLRYLSHEMPCLLQGILIECGVLRRKQTAHSQAL